MSELVTWDKSKSAYLSAGEDEHEGSSSSGQTPGEQSPQQGLGHRAVAFQHGARPRRKTWQTNTVLDEVAEDIFLPSFRTNSVMGEWL